MLWRSSGARGGSRLDTQQATLRIRVRRTPLLPPSHIHVTHARTSQDFDGMDFDMGHEVNCSSMNLRDIKMDVFSFYEIVDVRFNNASLDWQVGTASIDDPRHFH